MFTEKSCFDLLERFTGIQPTVNSVGNPEVYVGDHYYISACLVDMKGSPLVEEGPKIMIVSGTGDPRQPSGSGSDEVQIGYLILHALSDIKLHLLLDQQKVNSIFRTCSRQLGQGTESIDQEGK